MKLVQHPILAFAFEIACYIFSSEHIRAKYCGSVIFSLGFSYLTNISNLAILVRANIKINVECNCVGMVKEYEENVRVWSIYNS